MYFLENNVSQAVFYLKKEKGKVEKDQNLLEEDRVEAKAQRRGFSVVGDVS